MGLSAGAANEILKGERRVSAKMAARLSKRLLLDPSEHAALIGEFPERVARAVRELPVELRDVSSLTMPADPKLLPEAKVILRRAQDQIE